MITIKEIVEYVMENRKGNAFKNWTETEVCQGIKESVDDGSFKCCVNKHTNKIVGVAQCRVNHQDREFHVANLLTTEPGAISTLYVMFLSSFPGYQMTGVRNGNFVRPRMNSLTTHLCHNRN